MALSLNLIKIFGALYFRLIEHEDPAFPGLQGGNLNGSETSQILLAVNCT